MEIKVQQGEIIKLEKHVESLTK